MAQGIVSGEIMVGPGKLRTAVVTADDAKELTVIAAAVPVWAEATWTYQGLTDGGVQASLQKSYANHTVDQAPDWVASTITERHASIATNLAVATLDKIKLANNGGEIVTGVGTGAAWDRWEPTVDTLETPETYLCLAIEGRRQDGKRLIAMIRRALSVDNMDFSFTKDGKTMWSVSWAGHFVSDTVAPVAIYTER